MSKYVRSVTHKIEFDGDVVDVVLKPITLGDLLRLNSTLSEPEKFVAQVAEVLPSYVEKHSLKDAAGTDVTISEICSVAYFMPLMVKIGTALVASARPQNP